MDSNNLVFYWNSHQSLTTALSSRTACKGHVAAFKILASRGGLEMYKNKNRQENEMVVKGTINTSAKPTPMQWACFKSQIQIVTKFNCFMASDLFMLKLWLLLQNDISWSEVDSFGNNSVMLASAGGNY